MNNAKAKSIKQREEREAFWILVNKTLHHGAMCPCATCAFVRSK